MLGWSGAKEAAMYTVRLRNDFPRRTADNSHKTSEPDKTYNCFGWAVRNVVDAEVFMAPFPPGYFWPIDDRSRKLSAMVAAFEAIGFVQCDGQELEAGFEKVVLYATGDVVDHAARQKPNGKWTSKLGEEEDIEHATPEVLSGGRWGEPAVFMKRPLPQ